MDKTLSKIGVAAIAPALALTLMASPASAQRYHDRDRNDSGKDAVIGAVVGGLAGAIIGNGDGRYVAGGALAGAAVGVASSDNDRDCNYYRGGRCYRNQGHWEREHGIKPFGLSQDIRAKMLTPAEANKLGEPIGVSALQIIRRYFDAGNGIYLISVNTFRSRDFVYNMRLELKD